MDARQCRVRGHEEGHAPLAAAAHASQPLAAYSIDRLGRALETLLRRTVKAGVIRDDIDTEDILRTIVGLCYTHDKLSWRNNVLRLVNVFVDGMRCDAAKVVL